MSVPAERLDDEPGHGGGDTLEPMTHARFAATVAVLAGAMRGSAFLQTIDFGEVLAQQVNEWKLSNPLEDALFRRELIRCVAAAERVCGPMTITETQPA